MNKNIHKNLNIINSIIIFLLEILMVYLIVNSILTKDLISPNEISFYEYLKVKLSNII